jgi:drug/metabolite transporter, DME family
MSSSIGVLRPLAERCSERSAFVRALPNLARPYVAVAVVYANLLPNSRMLSTFGAMRTEGRTTGGGSIVAAAVIWGTVGPAQVLAGSAADPGALGALRLLVGGAVLLLPVLRGFPWRALLSRETLPWVVAAALSTALYQATFLYAVEHAGAALGTAVALGCAPFATGVFAWWWTRRLPDLRWLLGTAAAVLGCALVLGPDGEAAVSPVGVVFAIVSGCCYGAYTVAAKIFLGTGLPGTVTVAPTLVLGGLMSAPLIALHPESLTGGRTLAFVAWSGLVCTALAYALFARGLAHSSAARAGTLSLAKPLTAAALGVLVLGEQLTLPAAAGCLCLFCGLAVVAIPGRRTRDDPAHVPVATEYSERTGFRDVIVS